ncbi:hypothetical protein PybrP1_003365 [[Pythium] brassicae (nom. inval.)]|nr:hypothetical protein PybrP1_003365 [[Pythium] brassicae (nom. inval.)]
MAKKRPARGGRKEVPAARLDAHVDADVVPPPTASPSLPTQQKDLADASAEDVARASLDASDGSTTTSALPWPPLPLNDLVVDPDAVCKEGGGGSEHANETLDGLVVPDIKTYDLDSSSSGFLGKYIDEEVHHQTHNYSHGQTPQAHGSHHSLHNIVHSTSPSSSLLGGGGVHIPHSKSLVVDEHSGGGGVVLQALPSSKVEAVEVMAEQSWLVTKLTVQLLWALRMSRRWMLCAIRLTWFVILLFPPLFGMVVYFFFDAHIHKNIIYGLKGRNLLDVYTVPGAAASAPSDASPSAGNHTPEANDDKAGGGQALSPPPPPRYPVVVFFTGGAWIIGYKAWGALIGKVLSAFGIVVVTPDYRNFPQGILPDMVDDAMRAMQWVFDNIHLFGGDPENVTIVGQSAGAHIAVCAMLELVEKKEASLRRLSSSVAGNGRETAATRAAAGAAASAPSPTYSTSSRFSHASSTAASMSNAESLIAQSPSWELKQVRSFIGISGPYNIEVAVETFHRHGFDKTVVERIMDSKLAYYSPALRLLAKSELPHVARVLEDFPPMFLFHGTGDKTVSWRSSAQFASALEACRVPVKVRYFEGKSHTDPIIEDPILGDDFLLDEIRKIITACAPRDVHGAPRCALGSLSPSKRSYPSVIVNAARRMNPF